jgi:hypothetical protein
MSGRGQEQEERSRRFEQERVVLRQRMAEVAATVADTEEQVASTLEDVAEHRPPSDAERLRAQAEEARQIATKEHRRAASYRADSP